MGRFLDAEGVVEMQLAIGADDGAVAHGHQRVEDAPIAGRHVDAAHHRKVAAAAGAEHLLHEGPVERLRRLEHDVGIGDVSRQDALGQDEQPGARIRRLVHQPHDGRGVLPPFPPDGELPERHLDDRTHGRRRTHAGFLGILRFVAGAGLLAPGHVPRRNERPSERRRQAARRSPMRESSPRAAATASALASGPKPCRSARTKTTSVMPMKPSSVRKCGSCESMACAGPSL